MKKVLKIILVTLALSLTLSTCGQKQLDRYKETFHELNRDPKSRNLQGNENDVNDLVGCQIGFELKKWKLSEYGSGKTKRYVFDRDVSGYDGRIISSGGDVLDFNPKQNSSFLINQKDKYLVYLGPWHPITLTHTSGSFLNSQQIKEQKLIRFFAYQPKEGGPIQYQYESQTEENKFIPEKKFSLSPSSKYAPDKFSLCVVKWTAKYGYNAVADLHPNPWFPFFTREYLTGSGKIIDSETGEVIADEKGDLIKNKE